RGDAIAVTEAEAAATEVAAIMKRRTQEKLARRLMRESNVTKTLGEERKRNLSDFVYAVMRNDGAYLEQNYNSTWGKFAPRLPVSQKAALVESSGSTGGYLVPTPMAAPILATGFARSIFRSHGATSIPY